MKSLLHVAMTGEPELQFGPADRITVGRNPSCDLVVADKLVSREHCVIEQHDGQWTVVDTSSNGTFVGDQRISWHPLGGGEPVLLRLGSPDTGPAVTVRIGELTATPAEPTIRGPVIDLIPAVPDDIAALHPRADQRGSGSQSEATVNDIRGQDLTAACDIRLRPARVPMRRDLGSIDRMKGL